MRKDTGETAIVLAEFDGFYWLAKKGVTTPWTSPKEPWETPRPKAGDVWKNSSDILFRVIGVDEVNKTYLIVRKEDFADGAWPHRDSIVEFPSDTVFVRKYPHPAMELVERQT